MTANVNYVGSYTSTDPSSGYFTCTEAINAAFTLEFWPPVCQCTTVCSEFLLQGGEAFTDVDLYGKYQFTDHLSGHISVVNLFNSPPPFDDTTYGGGGGAAYSAALSQSGAVGRFITLGATYKF